MKQQELGINQQVFVGVAGELFSAHFASYFTDFTHKLFEETMYPTGVTWFGSNFFPSLISTYLRDCLLRNQYASILILEHALPKSLDFMMSKVTFFEKSDVCHGMWLSNEIAKQLPDEAFPPISHPSWLYMNLKNYLSLDLKVNFHVEDVDVLL